MVSPGWVAAGISIVGILIAWGGTWAVVKYRLQKVEEAQRDDKLRSEKERLEAEKKAEEAQRKNEASGAAIADRLANAIDEFRITIRGEFDRATEKINRLLFEDGGTTRYVPRGEYETERRDCRADLVRRVERLEKKVYENKS